jgi:glycosyltransferase involved in cell wall biosynthesis
MYNQNYPKITVVTPSYNQGQFIEQTILSVIGQNYPNLEYIIMDGGSSDNTVEIIKKYEKHISYWVSAKDNGQAEAINRGFARSTGSILAWLNSDDYYLPNTLFTVAKQLPTDKPSILIGNCIHTVDGTNKIFGSRVDKKHQSTNLLLEDYVIQPSSFWNKLTWEEVGTLDEKLHYVFDWDWFIRALNKNVVFNSCQDYLSVYRIHKNHKTGSGSTKRNDELLYIYQKYAPKEITDLYNYLFTNRQKIWQVQETAKLYVSKRVEQQLIRRVFFPYLSKFDFQTLCQVALMIGIDIEGNHFG